MMNSALHFTLTFTTKIVRLLELPLRFMLRTAFDKKFIILCP